MEDSIKKCICLFDVLAVPGYIAMTAMVYLSFVVPSIKALASHGKTRLNGDQRNSSNASSTLLHNLIYGESWMVKKKRFRQFYILGILFLTATVWLSTRMRPSTAPSAVTASSTILLYVHLLRRLYECTYVHKWKDTSVMHVAGYLVGAIHYLWLPMTFIRLPCDVCLRDTLGPSALTEQLLKQYSNGPLWVEQVKNATDSSSLLWRILPILMCLWGQYQQHVHHVILANMRRPGAASVKDKPMSSSSSSSSYSLPTTGWFQYVACPHYLAEIIVYVSFAILLRQEQAQGTRHYVVAFWVASNLTLSALINYKWYKENLPPAVMKGKKAIFPFLL